MINDHEHLLTITIDHQSLFLVSLISVSHPSASSVTIIDNSHPVVTSQRQPLPCWNPQVPN